ncbi:GlpM family protein [Pectobacterium brasiliense]|uniref:GlpM family protein n=1 Tax=Pectobacterium brasiliense TaxID=180957 RepID=A0A433N8J0_9GAMM|nr:MULTISPECIES: GlpM family protein [Pectobacterium]GKW29633.1 membrane protein [Pectobacterium carotovorum subsp. carotovorum]MBN3045794.1 GlpM family protein [Pectobacterium brasiliense]MBN3057730.1 GlpM family protein [Pectobacterium brasiliense]MBN3076115.1 GlpM family protein [Pectobacterium brasiliense]MBN3086562.1 GlpM family protein [Pectobacterium brasiliense]
MSLFIKSVIGALIVLLISVLAKSRNYYIAGLVPLFPTFALIAHYIVGTERGLEALRATILFGIWSVIPYLVYLISLYYFTAWMKLPQALLAAVVCWIVSAALLVKIWTWYQGNSA